MPNDEEINGEIIIIDDNDILASAINPPKTKPRNLRSGQKKGREIKVADEENEGADSENEGVENKVLPHDKKGYCLWNTPTMN